MFQSRKPEQTQFAPLPPASFDVDTHTAPSNSHTTRKFATSAQIGEGNCSIINEWLTMKGDLESEGDILVKGRVHGNILCKLLIIDADAFVEGGITAEEVIIRGRTKGVVQAMRVRLEKTAVVDSEIFHDTFSAEEGARIRGALRFREEPQRQAAPVSNVVTQFALPQVQAATLNSGATPPPLNGHRPQLAN
jgi:cytoskeletal protein CcmA (bactofilin family)